jgi:UDP-N-acetylglucosamine:LPS N-acetylglucosamine transferase
MDLAVLGKSALLVPTPGQCEQEYLAGYLGRKGWFNWVPQDKLKLEELISKTLSHPIDLFTGNELDEAISGLYSNQKNYKGRKVADKKACIYL